MPIFGPARDRRCLSGWRCGHGRGTHRPVSACRHGGSRLPRRAARVLVHEVIAQGKMFCGYPPAQPLPAARHGRVFFFGRGGTRSPLLQASKLRHYDFQTATGHVISTDKPHGNPLPSNSRHAFAGNRTLPGPHTAADNTRAVELSAALRLAGCVGLRLTESLRRSLAPSCRIVPRSSGRR